METAGDNTFIIIINKIQNVLNECRSLSMYAQRSTWGRGLHNVLGIHKSSHYICSSSKGNDESFEQVLLAYALRTHELSHVV